MAEDKIRLPSGQGGLVRYTDEAVSKIMLSPGTVIVLCVVLMLIVILLHTVGGKFFGG